MRDVQHLGAAAVLPVQHGARVARPRALEKHEASNETIERNKSDRERGGDRGIKKDEKEDEREDKTLGD